MSAKAKGKRRDAPRMAFSRARKSAVGSSDMVRCGRADVDELQQSQCSRLLSVEVEVDVRCHAWQGAVL